LGKGECDRGGMHFGACGAVRKERGGGRGVRGGGDVGGVRGLRRGRKGAMEGRGSGMQVP